jgi:hypothetical protein
VNRFRDDGNIGHSGEEIARVDRIPAGVDAGWKSTTSRIVGHNKRCARLGTTSEARLSTEIWFVAGVYVK